MPLGLQGLLHSFKIEAHKSAELFYRNLALAVGPVDGLHAHFRTTANSGAVNHDLFIGSPLMLCALRTGPTIQRRALVVKEPCRGHEGTGGDTKGQ